jgi:2,3-bisphosphoglycerate-independent phosphoglycerate mutase
MPLAGLKLIINNATPWRAANMSTTAGRRRVLTVVMDGVGISQNDFGNAVANAAMPNLNWLSQNATWRTLAAHGKAVGLPSDNDIGNSEVGHNALGAGRIFDQGAKLVQNAIADGSIFEGPSWQELVAHVKSKSTTMHFLGLLSDGNVHAHEQHLYAMLRHAKQDGVTKVRVHVLLDGRDVGEKTAEIYVGRLNQVINELASATFDIKVASGGGRMSMTMDRYEADWPMVKRGWDCHVHGIAPHYFDTLSDALRQFRKDPSLTDQYIPAFVIGKKDKPLGRILDNDVVVFFNFRGDRAMEISRAFTDANFDKFDRKPNPKVLFAGMMEYDGDLKVPSRYLVSPPAISDTLGEFLSRSRVRQFACSETQKFGHVTYFWNGNRSGYFDKNFEEYVEITSDTDITFDKKPWMKAYEITEQTIARMRSGSFEYGRINLANGDMVGHTGNYEATLIAVETVDLMLGRLISAARETDTILMVTADHGNADEMFDAKAKDFPEWRSLPLSKRPTPKTAHTINPVPFAIFDPTKSTPWKLDPSVSTASLGNVANTVLTLLGLKERDSYLPSLILPE